MANNVELTATELAALDLMIADQRANPDGEMTGGIVRTLVQTARITVQILTILGGYKNVSGGVPQDADPNATLLQLLEIRKNAIVKK